MKLIEFLYDIILYYLFIINNIMKHVQLQSSVILHLYFS